MSMERKELGERLSSLSPDELEELLRSLASPGGSSEAEALDAERNRQGGVPPDGVFPATYAQILFWRQYDADREGFRNHQSMAFRIRGELDVEVLKSSFQILSDFQPSLRTVCFEDDQDVWQRIEPSLPIPFEFVDSNEVPDTEDFLKRPFELEFEPPIRVRLVRESVDVHLLQIVMHHIASDGRSKVVMLQELSEYYNALKAGRTPLAKIHATSLGRKALEEREWLYGKDSAYATRHWEESPFVGGLQYPWPAGRHRVSDLNTDAEAPGRLDFDLGVDLSGKVRAFAAERGMTPLQLLMGCYLLCLQRLVPGSGVTVAMPVDLRGTEEEASLVGCLMNVVPVTMDAETPNSVDAYLSLAAERMRNAIEHARMPLYRILEIGYESDRSVRNLSWKTLVNFKEEYADSLILTGLSVESLPFRQFGVSGEVELTLSRSQVKEGQHSIAFSADFDVSKISLADASCLMETWRSVIVQCVNRDVVLFSDIDILLPGEKERLYELSGRDNKSDYPETTLHAIFRQTAGLHPDRPAVIEADGLETSYAELQRYVLKVAAFLRTNGTEKGDVIALHMHRSPDLLASMLGILEAGGAFLLLEPSLPLDRLRTMAEEACVKAIITAEGLEVLPGFSNRTYDHKAILSEDLGPTSENESSNDPDALAYVMFTSGSTGVPKGAMLEHRNISNYLHSMRDAYSFGPDDRALQSTSLSFDLCLTELLLPLLTGGGVVMPEPDIGLDMPRFASIVIADRVSYLFLSPLQMGLFLETPGVRDVNSTLRVISCGGESMGVALMEKCIAALDLDLFHSYGPVEAAVWATAWKCRSGHGGERLPIGRPNAKVDILIMDAHGRPVPPGMPGELWIGGAQTGRGYINNGEETKKRFVDDPIDPGSGRRYYRTGDLARFLPDGNLLFLGRMDDQLKVRGVRIELGDVTAALLRCEGVCESVVLAEPDGEDSNRLRAWVTVKDESVIHESSVRSSMTKLLPGYMVPFRIHVIDSIPLTPHGKTDHRALRAMAEKEGDETEGLPLITSTEHRLASVWSELLGVEVMYRDADFFRLGGHSLIAMRLAGRMHKEFGVAVSLSDFYTDGRLDRLAERIDAGRNHELKELRLSDMPGRLPGELVPMSWAQRRMWMLQQMLKNPSSYHIAKVFPIHAGLSANEVKSILHTMADRHGILRTRLYQEDDGFWQEELPLSKWRMDWRELAAGSESEWTTLASKEREQPFELSQAPGWRARWIRQQTGEEHLLLVFHHAFVDEWSMNLFRKEFEVLLTGKASPSSLDNPSHSYIDFARWQHWSFSQGLQERLETYWKDRLSELGEPVRLTPDLQPTEGLSGRSASVTKEVDASIHGSMQAFCKSEGISRFSVWMAVWQILQSRLGTGEEVLLATPVSERDRSEWQDVMGMCLNTLPIRARVDEQASFRSFSKKSHLSLAGDLSHGQLPYEEIIRLADKDLGSDGHGLPQVMFVWHGEYEWSEEDGISNGIAPKARYAKNPITVHLTDRGDVYRVALEYDAGLFWENTAETLIRRFEAVVGQVMENPDIRIADIDILLPGERERLWKLSGRDHVVAYPDTTLHEIFHQTAQRYPDRTAVIEPDGRGTSYAELRGQVDKVAAFLNAKGLEREAVVAVHLRRSPALLATMLGISEAGGTFFLMESSLPLDRLRTMAEQARVVAVITEAEMPIIPGFSVCTHRFNDILASNISGGFAINTSSGSTSLACVIFTSGSTGIPKGAMLEQVNLYNYLFFLRDVHEFGPGVRTLHKTTLSFDPALYELLLPMTVGGAVVLAETGLENDTPHIVEMVERHRADYLFFAPAQLRFFLQHPGLDKLNGAIKILQCAGEALEESLMEQCLSTLDASLSNAYGPAEAGAVTQWICQRDHPYPKPSIGPPNCNVDVWIMDAKGRPVPPGMPGELWIGGAQTGRGYIKNPDETRKRFVEDPMEPGSGRRYYRTGDLARFLPDGNLLFLGRMDDQLKVRGVRIELGDVAAALHRCEGVREAVVLAEPDGEGSNRLRGWVTLKDGVEESESTIRKSLIELLPGYMVPFRIHVIDSIPFTPHGKTDHRALRALAESDVVDADEGLPLETETQRTLAELWTALLRVEVKSRDADFFRLGGHSLIAMRLAGRIHSVFGISVPLPDFFSNGRLDLLASWIDSASQKMMSEGGMGSLSVSNGVGPKGDAEPYSDEDGAVYPTSHIQTVMWRHDRTYRNVRDTERGSMYRLQGRLDVEALGSAIDLLSRSQPALRTVFFERGGEVCQRVKPIMTLPLELVESTLPLSDLSLEEEMFDMPPFDLEKGPLLRFRLVSHGGDSHILQVSRHHIVFDAVSTVQMFRELSEYYNAILSGERPEPKKRSVSVGDLAVEEKEWLRGKEAEEGFRYWMGRLDLRGMEHGWPESGPDKPAVGPGRSEPFEVLLDAGLTRRIRSYTGRRGTTLFRFMLGTYFTALQSLLPGRAVTVGVPVSLRRTEEENELIGCLINPLPVTLEGIDSDSVSDRLGMAELRLDEAICHGRIQDRLIIGRWKRQRGVGRNLAPKTMLNFREQHKGFIGFNGLKVEPMQVIRRHQSRELVISMDGNSDWIGLKNIGITGTFDDSRMTRSQVDLVMDAWVSVMRHCTDYEDWESGEDEGRSVRVYAFAGGSGGFDAHSKLHGLCEGLGEGFRMQVLPDPEACFGRLPGMGVRQLARRHAEKIRQTVHKGRIWLLGEGLGAVDAFTVACELQEAGVKDVGLILLDPVAPTRDGLGERMRMEAVDAYGRMPERMSRIEEALFGLRLRASTSGSLGMWPHPVPSSRSQVHRAALAYGLFDPHVYRERCGHDSGASPEELLRSYLDKGWKEGLHPAEGFHAYRYGAVVEGFAPGVDEPLLHALLFGMRKRERRSRILEGMARPLERSEILSARRHLRLDAFEPGLFKGEAHVVMSGEIHDNVAKDGWRRWFGEEKASTGPRCMEGENETGRTSLPMPVMFDFILPAYTIIWSSSSET